MKTKMYKELAKYLAGLFSARTAIIEHVVEKFSCLLAYLPACSIVCGPPAWRRRQGQTCIHAYVRTYVHTHQTPIRSST